MPGQMKKRHYSADERPLGFVVHPKGPIIAASLHF